MNEYMDPKDYKTRHKMIALPCVRIRANRAGGSGTVIYSHENDNGDFSTYILTNHHVVDKSISVKKEWSSLLKKERKMDYFEPVDAHFFEYKWESRNVGGSTKKCEIMTYDPNEDLALLKLMDPRPVDSVASLFPRGEEKDLKIGMPVVAVGAGLGAPPVQTEGVLSQFGIDIERKEFWLQTGPTIYGNCLTADTLVTLKDGSVKPIVEVEAGDWVWSFGGNSDELQPERVNEVVEAGEKDVYKVKTRTRTVRASANHPFPVVVSSIDWMGRRTNWLEWRELADIEPGDVVAILSELPDRCVGKGVKFQDYIPQGSDINDFMRFLGFYLGDGWMRHEPGYRYEVSLATYDKDSYIRYKNILKNLFGLEPVSFYETDTVLQVNGKKLVETLEKLGFSGKATEKTVPAWVMTQPFEYQMAFIEGYLEADGYTNPTGDWVFEANNEKLISRLRMMFIHMGFNVSNIHDRIREPVEINGKMAIPNSRSYAFQVYPNYSKNRNTTIYGDTSRLPDNLCYEKVRSIANVGVEQTYDIKVEKHHNFFANGMLVHNSGGALFLRDTYELIGVPARIAVTLAGFSTDAITHLSFAIPITRIYNFLEEQKFRFVYDDDYTEEGEAELRGEMREKAEKEMAGEG